MPDNFRRRFNDQFNADAVSSVRKSGKGSQLALDVGPSSIARCYRVGSSANGAGHGSAGALHTAVGDELSRLRRDYRALQLECDFLKRALSFFAKDQAPTSS